MSSSLQRRISLGVIANTAGVVLIAAIAIWFANRGWLLQGIDRELQNRAERMHRFDNLPSGDMRPRQWLMPETKADSDERIDLRRPVLVMDAANGNVLMRASQLPADFAARLNPSNRGLQTLRLNPDLKLRILAILLQRGLPMGEAGNRPVILFLASDLSPLDEDLTRMAALLTALWVTASFLAWVSVRWSGRVMLRPISDLSAALDRLGPDDLASRLPSATGPREFRAVVDRLNLLLDRLEQAFRREQATIQVIAHELRTPVATLRTAVEFRQLVATDPGEKAVLATCFRTVERMQSMVTNLLLLARLEAGKEPLPRTQVDLVEALHDALEEHPDIHAELPLSAMVMTSPMHVRLVIDNLLGNAVAHGSPQGLVRVTVTDTTLTITNPCAEGLDPQQLGTIFYRADAARTDGDHCGLGLALVKRLVKLLDGTLSLSATHGIFKAEVVLPRGVADTQIHNTAVTSL